MIDQKFKLLQVIESVNAIIWEYDIAKDSWEYVSPQTKRILGYEPEEWTDLDFWVRNVHKYDRVWAKNYCLRATSEGRDHVFEYRFMKKDGSYIWLRDEVVVIMKDNKPITIRGFMTNITELKKREEHIKYISFHDELTGLYNRRFFDKELERYDHPRYFPLTVIMGDLNKLKLINDTNGHEMGDNYLKIAASIIKTESGDNYVVSRWGGDEFTIIMPKADSNEANELISRINDKLDETEFEHGELSIAFGYGTKINDDQNIKTIFKLAEKMMYKNKND